MLGKLCAAGIYPFISNNLLYPNYWLPVNRISRYSFGPHWQGGEGILDPRPPGVTPGVPPILLLHGDGLTLVCRGMI